MKDSKSSKTEAQGAESQSGTDQWEGLTLDQVEKWLIDDLGRARSLLEALHTDRNILRMVAVHLHGKAMNYIQAKNSAEKVKEN